MVIRRAILADAPALAELGARTFVDAFGAMNNPDDLAAYLAKNFGIEQQRAEIANPDGITLLVEEVGALIGFAQVRRAEENVVELARFYVERAWHGKGVAQHLMREVENAARELGAHTVKLSVWEKNPRGIAFYAKEGFTDAGGAPFIVGSDVQTDRVMVKRVGET